MASPHSELGLEQTGPLIPWSSWPLLPCFKTFLPETHGPLGSFPGVAKTVLGSSLSLAVSARQAPRVDMEIPALLVVCQVEGEWIILDQ